MEYEPYSEKVQLLLSMTDDNPPPRSAGIEKKATFNSGNHTIMKSRKANLLCLVDACDNESTKIGDCSGGSENTKKRKRFRFMSSKKPCHSEESEVNKNNKLVQIIRPNRKKTNQTKLIY